MDEYIRREDAVDDLHTQLMYRMGSDDMKRRLDDWVKTLPSADVTPVVHGRWMPQKGGGLCCSECGKYALDEPDGNFIHVSVPSKFCPNCGAKMDRKE